MDNLNDKDSNEDLSQPSLPPVMILGIDLGKLGGYAWQDIQGMHTKVMFLDTEGELDIFALHIFLKEMKKSFSYLYVVFEDITPLHLASKSANWSLAFQSGAVTAACISLGILYKKVPAKVWQRELFSNIAPLRKKDGSTDTKAMALLKTRELYPDLDLRGTVRSKVPHQGIVDAVLLREWGQRNIKNPVPTRSGLF